jgi:hypothetical protein
MSARAEEDWQQRGAGEQRSQPDGRFFCVVPPAGPASRRGGYARGAPDRARSPEIAAHGFADPTDILVADAVLEARRRPWASPTEGITATASPDSNLVWTGARCYPRGLNPLRPKSFAPLQHPAMSCRASGSSNEWLAGASVPASIFLRDQRDGTLRVRKGASHRIARHPRPPRGHGRVVARRVRRARPGAVFAEIQVAPGRPGRTRISRGHPRRILNWPARGSDRGGPDDGHGS